MFDELRHFLLICEHGSFTAAARHAHLTQPSLSASIKRLEDQVGARLLHRLPRGARPTAAGEALIPHARAALGSVERGLAAVGEVEGLRAGSVRIGGGATACTYLLPPLLVAFSRRYPGVRLKLEEILTPRVPEAISAGVLDIGVAQEGGEPWMRDELILVGAPGVAPERFVAFIRGAAIRTLLDLHFPDAEIVMELSSFAAVKGQTRAGMGVALLSRAACADDLALGTLVEIPDPRLPIFRTLHLVHPGLDALSPAARALRTMLLEVDAPLDLGRGR